MDKSAENEGVPPQEGMCEPSPIHNARSVRRLWWPFYYFQEDGRWYVNRAKKRSRADQAADIGEAQW